MHDFDTVCTMERHYLHYRKTRLTLFTPLNNTIYMQSEGEREAPRPLSRKLKFIIDNFAIVIMEALSVCMWLPYLHYFDMICTVEIQLCPSLKDTVYTIYTI